MFVFINVMYNHAFFVGKASLMVLETSAKKQ